MSDERLDLDAFDRDGALRETAAGASRRDLLAGAGAGLAGAALVGFPARADAALARRDRAILNYALTLEELQAAFYAEAKRIGALRGRAKLAAEQLGSVERAHVRAFRSLLGRRAIKRPNFDFRGTTEDERAFLRTAVALEDLSVEAYKDQAPRLRSREVLQAAVGIHSVEAQHAAWMRYLFGVRPATAAFDDAAGRKAVLRQVAATRFVTRAPRTEGRRRSPRFTG